MAGGGDGVSAQFTPGQFREFMAAVKRFDPKLATALRRRLRRAGDDTVKAMQQQVLSGPGSGVVGIRTAIASGIKTSVATGKRAEGIRIQSSGSKLPAGRRPMLRLYNKKSWRHPVYGRKSGTWVVQQGQPFFGSTIRKHEDRLRGAVQEALGDALKEIS